jgi:hypothetical protein
MRQPSDKMRELRRRSFWRWGSRSAGSRRPSWLLPTSQNSGPDLLTAFRRIVNAPHAHRAPHCRLHLDGIGSDPIRTKATGRPDDVRAIVAVMHTSHHQQIARLIDRRAAARQLRFSRGLEAHQLLSISICEIFGAGPDIPWSCGQCGPVAKSIQRRARNATARDG